MLQQVSADPRQQQIGKHLAWYAEQYYPMVVVAVLMVPFPFQIGTTNSFFQSGGMVPECHTAVKTACNPRIMVSPPALSSSALMLQTPAAFPPLNFAKASLTSSVAGAVRRRADQHPASLILRLGGSTMNSCSKNSAQRTICV